MLKRLYAHNFRCFENFEFKPKDQAASLLLGKNGSGKSTVKQVLALFQAIGSGKTRMAELLKPSDFSHGRVDLPMRFELEVVIDHKIMVYSLALELPDRFRELRVKEERLTMDGEELFSRDLAEVTVSRKKQKRENAVFSMDWHMVALPVIQDAATEDILHSIRDWMTRMVLLAPIPQLMNDQALGEQTGINDRASNVADWLAALLESYPSAYAEITTHLQQVMPDLASFRFERLGRDARALMIQFSQDQKTLELPFSALSDGEKCFFLSAVLIASNKVSGPVFAFWDEPDNYLAPSEVNQFIVALKRSFLRNKSQLIATSHNPEATHCFPEESIWVMGRHSHLEPSLIRCLEDLNGTESSSSDLQQPDLIQRLMDGDLNPWL